MPRPSVRSARPRTLKGSVRWLHPDRKGSQSYFGMKAHIGVDGFSGLMHHAPCNAVNRGGSQAQGDKQGEHPVKDGRPLRVIKRQFGYTKVRYRGLVKNAAQVRTLFAPSNLWMVRRQLMLA